MAPSIDYGRKVSPNLKENKEKDEEEERVELYVERVQDSDPVMQKHGLEYIRQEIRTNPTSLKFLRRHYETLQDHYENMAADSDLRKQLADVLSVLSMSSDCLKYRLLGSDGDIGYWGHEYVRKLVCEIHHEYEKRTNEEVPVDDLMDLEEKIVAFYMKHNAEFEAVDLLISVGDLDVLQKYVVKENYFKTCLYLISLATCRPEFMSILDIVYSICMEFEDYHRALQIASRLSNMQYVKQVFRSCNDLHERYQFCFALAPHGITFVLDDETVDDDEEREKLQEITNNTKLNEGLLTLARDTELMDPISHGYICKVDLTEGSGTVDSARQNLAATFINAFVNAGFGRDTLMTVPSDSSSGDSTSTSWVFKNKEHGKTSAAASLGMVFLWDDSGLAQLDKYMHSTDTHVIAGALLGVGIVNCNVRNQCDPALVLLADYVDEEDSSIRIGAIMGLGLAYAGTQNEQVFNKLMPLLGDRKASLDVIAFAAISLGLVYVGSCNEEVAQAIIFALMDRSEQELDDPLVHFMPLGLGLLYLGKQESVEVTSEVLKTCNEKIRKYCETILFSCAYAGTGDVLKVQHFLGQCAQPLEKGGSYQSPAVLGIAMVAMAGELDLEMAIRSLEHLLQYGDQNIRRAVPYALALLCISNPKVNVIDTLGRLSHDGETEVSIAAIISLGLIGAGTNNARIAGMLHNLSSQYYKHADLLFCVRIAQGLVHMGKGLMTLSPLHSERFLMSPTALAGILVMLHSCLDMKAIILGKYHYVLYFLVLAMQPRMLMTLDEDLKPLSVPVRVGKAVDVVGQPGCPKTITGFQTHSTPVVLSAGDRAELATEEYIPLTPILEGFVILRKNPDYHP